VALTWKKAGTGGTMFKQFDWIMPTKIIFGEGRLNEIGKIAAGVGNKAFLVTGKTAMKKLGFTQRVQDYLRSEGIDSILFDQIEPNPSLETANRGAQLAKENDCDVIIALGGGSTMDVAKAVSTVKTYRGSVEDYLGNDKVPGLILPIIAVPSTAGTGSEVTRYAVLTNTAINRKDSLRSEFIIPKVAIVDPELMVSQSPRLTSSTGIDALTHAVEAYTSPQADSFSDIAAAEAIRLVGIYLRRAVWEEENMEARSGMALASTLAGMAICQAGTGAAHGLGMSVGGFFNTEHGTTVGLILPYVMEYNFVANLEKYAKIATLLGEKVDGLSLRKAALKSIEAIVGFIQDIDIPSNLSQIGAKKEMADEIAKDAITQGAMRNNIRRLTSKEIKAIYKKACG